MFEYSNLYWPVLSWLQYLRDLHYNEILDLIDNKRFSQIRSGIVYSMFGLFVKYIHSYDLLHVVAGGQN